jgi:hypothetical protein
MKGTTEIFVIGSLAEGIYNRSKKLKARRFFIRRSPLRCHLRKPTIVLNVAYFRVPYQLKIGELKRSQEDELAH